MSSDVEAYVRQNPWRFCDHLEVPVEKSNQLRMWLCSKCGTHIMSFKHLLINRGLPDRTLLDHLKTSILVQYRSTLQTEEVSPELYEKLRGQNSIDVLRFPPADSDDFGDAMSYAAFGLRESLKSRMQDRMEEMIRRGRGARRKDR